MEKGTTKLSLSFPRDRTIIQPSFKIPILIVPNTYSKQYLENTTNNLNIIGCTREKLRRVVGRYQDGARFFVVAGDVSDTIGELGGELIGDEMVYKREYSK